MLKFDSEREFAFPPAVLFGRLGDLKFVVSCIPDVAEVREITADRASISVKPGFSFVRGNLDVNLEIVESAAPTKLRMLGRGKGIGSSNDVEVTLDFEPCDAGTRVRSSAEVKNLTGLLRAVPQGLIKAAAQKIVADVWNTVERRLAETN